MGAERKNIEWILVASYDVIADDPSIAELFNVVSHGLGVAE